MNSRIEDDLGSKSKKDSEHWHVFVQENFIIVERLVRRNARILPPLILDELGSELSLALTDAASKFKGDQEEFKKYIQIRLSGAVVDFLRKSSFLKKSGYLKIKKINALRQSNPNITVQQIAQQLNMPIELIDHLENYSSSNWSNNSQIEDHYDYHLKSAPATPEQLLLEKEKIHRLVLAITELPEKKKFIIQEYLSGKSGKIIAEELGVNYPTLKGIIRNIKIKLAALFASEDDVIF